MTAMNENGTGRPGNHSAPGNHSSGGNHFPGTGRPGNLILTEIPEEQYVRLARYLIPVEFPLGMRLSTPNEQLEFAYFPVSGLISTDALTSSGESVEIGVIGREGFAGLPGVLGHPQMSHAVRIQGTGTGFRLRVSVLREEFLKGGVLHQLITDFIYMQMVQITQSVLCNRMHEVEARLARWLLTSADRMQSERLELTQEFLAEMLGARRSTVTVAAGNLQANGFIEYSRGKIKIKNRPGLEGAACECYKIVRVVYDRMLPKEFLSTPDVEHAVAQDGNGSRPVRAGL